MIEKLSVEGSDGLGFDGQGMYTPRHQISQSIIHKAVALYMRDTLEATPSNVNGKMGAGVRAAVAGMAMVRSGVVGHGHKLWLQGHTQHGFDLGGRHRPGCPGAHSGGQL